MIGEWEEQQDGGEGEEDAVEKGRYTDRKAAESGRRGFR